MSKGRIEVPKRVVLYGPPGVGKTSLAREAPSPLFVDINNGTGEQDVARLQEPITSWDDLKDALNPNAEYWEDYKTVVLDTATDAQALCIANVLKDIKTEGGLIAESMDDYTWGKGPGHLYGRFLELFQILDNHVRKGRNVIVICHEAVEEVPNPAGENWIRWEPALANPKKVHASVRAKLIQWASYVLRIGYDVSATTKGKAKGGGSRRIFTAERPTYLAKSRALDGVEIQEAEFPLGDASFWNQIFLPEGE